jgi:hypothetical protein
MSSAAFPSSPGGYGDDLAAVVVRRLEKRTWRGSWGLAKTLLLGVPSFGLIPLLAWPARFRDYVAEESQAMQELAQWAKMRGRQPAAVGPLMAAAEDTVASPLPLIAALVLSAMVIGVYVIQFAHVPFSLDQLIELTYSRDSRMSGASPLSPQEFVYRLWVIALSVGYGIQWLHVRAHAADMRRFVERFNPVVQAEMLPAVRMPMRGVACFRPLWILTAVVLAMYGAWWGIPMVLAGMAQKRYTSLTGRVVRHELAKRVRDVVALRQTPAMYPPTTSRRCANPRCLASLRPHTHFCTRCGAAVRPEATT